MITKDQPNKYNEIPPQNTSLIEDEIRAGKIDKKMILETSLRSFYTEGSTQAARDNYRSVKEKSAGKAKNIFQKAASSIKNWTEDTVMRKAEETYMALSQGIATITGEKDNLNTLMKLTGDIFTDVHKYPDANIIREEIRARIIERMVNKETKLLGILDGLLQGEAASIAYALSVNADNSTDKVLHEFKTDPDGINANYIVDRLTNQILEARNTSAAIEGVENAMAANLLKRTVELQSKVKGSALGAREGVDVIKMAASTGLGTMSGLITGVVNKSANVDLSEKKRYDTIKENVKEGYEFKAIIAQIYKSVKTGEINEAEADLVLQEALSKLTFDAYLKVAEKELEVNAAAEETANPKNFLKVLQKAGDAASGANEITKLLGKGINETQFRALIPQLQEDLKNVSATEKSDAAKNLLSRIEEFTVFSSDKTDALVKQVRQQMTTITENGLVVAGNVVKNTAQMTIDTGAAALFSSPHMTALAGLTNTATMGNFSFSGQRGANLFDGGALDRRMNVVFGTDGEGLNTAQNINNIILNTALRANPINNIMLSGSNVVNGLGRVLSQTDRLAEFSGRVASSTILEVNKAWNNSGFGKNGAGLDAAESTLPQSSKPSGVDNLVAQAANVAKGGTMDFSARKSGEVVDYKIISNGKEIDLKPTYLGSTDGTSALRIDVENLRSKGYTIAEARSSAGNSYPVIRDSEGKIVENIRTGWLLDGKGNPTNIPIIIEGKGRDGDINAKQISEEYASSAPSVIAKARSEGSLNIVDKTQSSKPEATVVTPANSSAKPNLNNGTTAGSLLSGNAKIEGSDKTAADKINNTSNGSSFTALNDLRDRTGNAFQTVFNKPNIEPTSAEPTATTKPAAEQARNTQTSNAGGLKINVNNSSNNFNIYNNADLAATLGNGEYNSGISRQVLQEVIRQSNLADLQSRGTVQRLAYLAENKLPLPPELKGLTLSSGAKADAVYEGFVQNPDQAKNALAGVSSNANVATEIRTENTGKFMVLPVAGGLMANAERTWDELVQTITISSISTTGGDPTIALPNNAQESNAITGVKVENGIISARLGIDFKPLSKISLNLGNGINAIVDATQFPKLMDQLNSGKEVKLSDLLRNVATVNPEVAKAVGAIDTTKAVASNVLDIRAKDGKVVNLFEAIYKTRGLFNVVTDASGNVINSNNIGSSTQDNNILGPALKTLMNATPEQKIAFLKGIKEYNGVYLGPVDIANLSDTARAKWTLNRLFEQRNPGILKQDVITNEDLFKLGSGLNFSGTKVLEANLKEDVLKAFKHNTTLHPNSVPAQILLNINNQNNTLAQTIKYIEDAEKYVRGQNRDRMPSGWRPFLRDDISSRLRDIAVVQQAMGEKPADITRDHTYEGTIEFGGPGYKEKAFYNLYNLNYLPKEASQNFFKANEENPQVTTIAQRAYSNIMGIGIDGVRTGPLVNKLAVAVLSQFVPLSFAFSMEEKTTNNQSFYNLSPQDLASAETVTALAIKFTDPEYAKAYAKFISEKHTPEESLILALGAKPDASTGKWVVEGRNGFKQTFDSIDELNKFSKMARASVMKVEAAESVNASSSAGVKVFENNPVASVELGGSTLTAKESEELKQYLGNEAKNYEDNMVKARKMLVEAQANREKVAATLTATFTANSIREAMGLGTNGFLATHGEYKGGNKDGVISSTDNSTEAKANPDDVKRYKTELDEYRSGIRSSLPDPVMAYLIKCKNFTPIFGQDIPLTTSGEISTSGNTETDLNVQRNVKKGAEDVAMGVKPPKNNEEPPKKEEPKKEEPKVEKKQETELQTENTVGKDAPAVNAPKGANGNPQQGTAGELGKNPPSVTAPTTRQLEINNGGTTGSTVVRPDASSTAAGNVQVAPAPQVAPDPVVPAPSVTTPGFEAAQSTSQATQVISQPAAQATQNVTQEVVTQQAQQQVAQEVVQNQAIELTATGGAPLVADPLRPIADSVR